MRHKYGFHVNRTGEDVFAAIARIKPKVIKTLDHNVGFWTRVRAIHPDVFLIGRLYTPHSEQERFTADPEGAGEALAERILRLEVNKSTFAGRRLFDAWESYNEAIPESASPAVKRAYDRFQVAFAVSILAAGFEPIAMNFATGNMLGNDFLTYFRGTLDTYTYLGFHEYDWPDMWRLHEQNIREKNEGGMWLTLRYRRIMDEVRRVYGSKHTVIITECGMTQGVIGGEDVGPWHPSHPIEEERYWRSLLWYNEELLRDDFVMAALLFVVGAISPWESFEHLGGIIDRLQAFQAVAPLPPGEPETPAEPVEPEEPGTPAEPEEPGAPAEPAEPEGPQPPELAEPTLPEKLLAAAAKAQVIQFNPAAALQRRIFADGFVPNSPEFAVEAAGVRYIGQRAEHLGTGEVRVYYVQMGEWDRVAYTSPDTAPDRRIAQQSAARSRGPLRRWLDALLRKP